MTFSFWKKLRHKLEWLVVATMAAVIPRLPRMGCVRLAEGLGAVFYAFDRRGRAVALANIEAAFGDTYTAGERDEIARKSIQTLARNFFDLFWAKNLTAENFTQYIDVVGPKPWESSSEDGKLGRLLFCQHFGCFEWGSMAPGFCGVSMPLVAQEFKNPALGPIFDRCRQTSGNVVVPRSGAMLRLVKHLKRGGIAGMLFDLTLRPDMPSVVVDVFGMKMCVTLMHAMLRKRLGVDMVAGASYPLDDGRVRLEFTSIDDISDQADELEIVQRVWDHFDPIVRRNPELWLWNYKHWRYKPTASTQAYPFYANQSKKFDKLLKKQQAVQE